MAVKPMLSGGDDEKTQARTLDPTPTRPGPNELPISPDVDEPPLTDADSSSGAGYDSTPPDGASGATGGGWWVIVILLAGAIGAGWWYLGAHRIRGETSDSPAAESAGATRPGGEGSQGKSGRSDGGKGQKGDSASRLTPVVAVAATKGSVNIYIDGLGTVQPSNSAVVRPRVDGLLMQILFKEGQTVKAGDVLAEIDPRQLEVQVAQALGQLAKDQAQLDNAKQDLRRYKSLQAQDTIAGQQLDTQQALVHQDEAVLQVDQAQVDNAKLQVSFTHVTAPISGRLGLRQVDAGNMVRANDTSGLVVITQLQPIGVIFPIPQDNLSAVMQHLNAGDTLTVEAYDRNGKTKLAEGTLLTADNQIDPATGTVKLKAEFPNQDSALFPSQFVNTRMLLETVKDTVVIPTAAVQRGTQGAFVYLVQADGTVAVRTIQLGPVEGERTAVSSGLAPGDVVVTDGADRLREGAKVTVSAPGAGRTRAGKGEDGHSSGQQPQGSGQRDAGQAQGSEQPGESGAQPGAGQGRHHNWQGGKHDSEAPGGPQGAGKDQSSGAGKDQSSGAAKDQSSGAGKDQSSGAGKDQSSGAGKPAEGGTP